MLKTAITLVLAAVAALGQNPRFGQVGEPFPDGIGQAIGAADFEGDGDVDLYTTVGVFLNTNGFFTPGPTMPPGFAAAVNIYAVAVADMTGDGRPDVVKAGGGGPTPVPIGISIFVAPAGAGTQFTMTPTIPGAALMNKFAVADFDGDGDNDVIGAATSTGSPLWQLFLNNGLGTMTAAPAAVWPAGPIASSWVAAGDFDGDGKIDVFATDTVGAIWRRNLGTGVFGPTIALGSPLIFDAGAVGDFDGDGDDDVFGVAVSGMEVIHLGSPTGLVAGTPVFGGILGPPPVAIDLEGDGDADVIRTVVGSSGSTDGPLQVRLGGPGGLGPPVTIIQATFGYGNPFPGIASLDVEGDGDPDIALVTGAGPPALVVNGGVNGFVVAPHPLPFAFGKLFAPPRDLDGDGDPDLLRASLANGIMSLVTTRNDGRGNFSEPGFSGSYPGFLGRGIWADFDLDGDSDLFAVDLLQTGTGTAMINNGSGVFTPGPTVAFTGPATALATADFDGDNDVDVVIGRGQAGGFPPTYLSPILIRSLFTQSGTVSFTPPGNIGIAEFVNDVEVFDAEPDGDLDLLVATVGPGGAAGTPRLYLNNGAGVFGISGQITGATAKACVTGDLNGDNAVDAVLGGQVWLQSGGALVPGPTFQPPLDKIALADLDLDGVKDLVDLAGRWYPGVAGGSFAAPINFVPFTPNIQIAAAGHRPTPVDLDGDGDLDLVGLDNLSSGSAAIYFNLTRHAGRTSLVSQNSTVSVAVWGPPSAQWLLAASVPGTNPQQLPPFGTLFLDPATITIIAGGTIPPNGRASVSAFLGPGLPGLATAWQALVGSSLTNGFDTVVLP